MQIFSIESRDLGVNKSAVMNIIMYVNCLQGTRIFVIPIFMTAATTSSVRDIYMLYYTVYSIWDDVFSMMKVLV